MLLSTAYFPPISWFAMVARDFTLSADRVFASVVYLEACESYRKQTWRNRCRILTSNGPEDLRVPIVHGPSKLITDVVVDYSESWIIKTERALDSAYDSSPYFEYYKDDIFAILESRPEKLWDLNLQLINHLIAKLGLSVDLRFTEDFVAEAEDDYRFSISPKNKALAEPGLEKPYYQVFSAKFGFIPDLSVLDLLFNEGPDSILYLKSIF